MSYLLGAFCLGGVLTVNPWDPSSPVCRAWEAYVQGFRKCLFLFLSDNASACRDLVTFCHNLQTGLC